MTDDLTHTYYISGPMRGYPKFNFPAFLECETYLMQVLPDDKIICPAAKDIAEGFDYGNALDGRSENIPDEMMHRWMRRDLTDVAASDRLVLLPGWEGSEGARREMSVAKWCGLQAYLYVPEGSWGHRLQKVSWDELAYQANRADARKQQLEDAKNLAANVMTSIRGDEVRTTSNTGGQKGVKPERHDLVPIEAMDEVARVYAFGAQKYDDHNWRKGYEWSKSYAALQRHARAFWRGEDLDPDSGLSHLGHVVFHALALLTWWSDPEGGYDQFDDRYVP